MTGPTLYRDSISGGRVRDDVKVPCDNTVPYNERKGLAAIEVSK
jgi:hypothetical protein